jgi:hypothetical protein
VEKVGGGWTGSEILTGVNLIKRKGFKKLVLMLTALPYTSSNRLSLTKASNRSIFMDFLLAEGLSSMLLVFSTPQLKMPNSGNRHRSKRIREVAHCFVVIV